MAAVAPLEDCGNSGHSGTPRIRFWSSSRTERTIASSCPKLHLSMITQSSLSACRPSRHAFATFLWALRLVVKLTPVVVTVDCGTPCIRFWSSFSRIERTRVSSCCKLHLSMVAQSPLSNPLPSSHALTVFRGALRLAATLTSAILLLTVDSTRNVGWYRCESSVFQRWLYTLTL
jgi:hypothetical protein